MSRLYRQTGIKGGSSHSGRRTLAAKVLATTGKVELVLLAGARRSATRSRASPCSCSWSPA
ncbi:hypothetical protein ACV1DK_22785, partial [Aeromonas taiwanensis]